MSVDKLVDSTQLDADLTSVANAIRTKGGTSAALAFPAGFVSAIGDIPTGGVQTPYQLGGFFQNYQYAVEVLGNHVKITGTGNAGNMSISLRELSTTLNRPTWFTINSGDAVVITYSNVVNVSNKEWNANLKRANTTTSLSYGIGNGTHLSGASVAVTPTTTEDIGCIFVYIANLTSGEILEFDVEMTVGGVRYI